MYYENEESFDDATEVLEGYEEMFERLSEIEVALLGLNSESFSWRADT